MNRMLIHFQSNERMFQVSNVEFRLFREKKTIGGRDTYTTGVRKVAVQNGHSNFSGLLLSFALCDETRMGRLRPQEPNLFARYLHSSSWRRERLAPCIPELAALRGSDQ
jgi:hypothetical protein